MVPLVWSTAPPTTTKLTVKLLDASAIVVRKLEGIRIHPLVEGSHDGGRVVGVLQAQSVAQLVHRHQENVVPWKSTETKNTGCSVWN